MADPVTIIVARLLQQQFDGSTNSSTVAPINNTTNSTDAGDASGSSNGSGDVIRDAYEFGAFILWYVFMVLCCIIPATCAYRRRQSMEERLRHERANRQQLYENQYPYQGQPQVPFLTISTGGLVGNNNIGGLFFFSNLHSIRDVDLEHGKDAMAERTRRIQLALQETTFTVKAVDISGPSSPTRNDPSLHGEETTGTLVADGDVGNDVDLEANDGNGNPTNNNAPDGDDGDEMNWTADYSSLLQLPRNTESYPQNANRVVPGSCAICLCIYEPGERVTWSKENVSSDEKSSKISTIGNSTTCKHAFHHDCIVPWLAKKNDAQPKCPCCRQVFCKIKPIMASDIVTLTPFGYVWTSLYQQQHQQLAEAARAAGAAASESANSNYSSFITRLPNRNSHTTSIETVTSADTSTASTTATQTNDGNDSSNNNNDDDDDGTVSIREETIPPSTDVVAFPSVTTSSSASSNDNDSNNNDDGNNNNNNISQ